MYCILLYYLTLKFSYHLAKLRSYGYVVVLSGGREALDVNALAEEDAVRATTCSYTESVSYAFGKVVYLPKWKEPIRSPFLTRSPALK